MIENIYNDKTIEKKRKYITKEFIKLSKNIKSSTIKQISIMDLSILFELYDQVFLGNRLRDEFQGSFKFSLSNRMTRSAAHTRCPKNISQIKPEDVVIEFRFGVDFFFQYEGSNRSKYVCGIETNHALEALQLVFEHEICHGIEFIYFHQSSCKGNRFKTIANNLFGHTSSFHQLPTNKDLAKEKLGLQIGDQVSFLFENQILSGVINGITKRATIMVKDKMGIYTDQQGDRYAKYYVPLSKIINDFIC